MFRKTVIGFVAWVMALSSLLMAQLGHAETLAPAISNTVVISEVQFDAPQGGTDSAYEWFELYNTSTSPITLTNWKLGDNSSSVRTFNATIPAHSAVIVAANLVNFTANFPSAICPVIDLGANIGNGLANGGDRLLISDTVGSAVDAISYGIDSTVLSPTINPGSNTDGTSIERLTLPDTDASADWRRNASPSPCSVLFTADVAVTKSVPSAVYGNAPIAFGVSVGNIGTVYSATQVVLTDTLPIGLSYISDTSGLTPTVVGQTLAWNIGTLNAGSVITFSLVVSHTGPGTYTNTLVASTQVSESVLTNNVAQATTTVVLLPPLSRIHEIQGAAQTSPLKGQDVFRVPGVVIAKQRRGFFVQDPNPDASDDTSEGIFVFTSITPTVSVGDAVIVTGTVNEFRSNSGGGITNLTQTEINTPSVQVLSSGNALPTATVIGLGGRLPPTSIIEDDAISGSVEISNTFDPTQDGLDFYESLEGMLVQVNNAVAVGPSVSFSSGDETPVLGDNGISATVRTPRGGVVIRPGDFNPERMTLSGVLLSGGNLPEMRVGDKVTQPITAVVDYNFGNFKLDVTAPFTVTDGGLTREVATAASTHELSIATFNVENLAPTDSITKFNGLANIVVSNLKSPDIIAVEEIQDNNGATNDAVVDASQTFTQLIGAISTAGGPAYQYRQIDPVDDQDGGQPGGNIRVGFLFRTDRGLQFVDRPGGTSVTATQVLSISGQLQLSFSPGRISPTSPYYDASRKPLAGEFVFEGQKLIVVANHFRSKGGDDPLFGRFQPPVRLSEITRMQQALLVHDFVSQALALDPKANLVVLGDLNDYQFSSVVQALKGNELNVLMDTLPENERYTYVFEGNSQAIDHMLISKNIAQNLAPQYDVVHVNAEFTAATRSSDHDPQVARLNFGPKQIKVFLPIIKK